MSPGDAGAASRERPMLAFADEFTIPVLCHPMRAREVRFMHAAASLGIAVGVQSEQNMDSLAPIGSVAFGVKEP